MDNSLNVHYQHENCTNSLKNQMNPAATRPLITPEGALRHTEAELPVEVH